MQKSTVAILAVLFVSFLLNGCALFVSHYDAGAYQYFTSLKAFHVKFLEDGKVADGKVFDESKTKATCDTGELKFREAAEYAKGKHDDTRVSAIGYLHNVFKINCRLTLDSKKLFGTDYAEPQIEDLKKNYDLAIEGESARVNAPSK